MILRSLFLLAVCQVESFFVGHRYLANATRSLEADLVTDAGIYVNWNNMAAHWYYPSVNGSGQINHECDRRFPDLTACKRV